MVKEDKALVNEIRRKIFKHISIYPGVSFNVLKNIFELSESGLRYHLDYLEKCEKIGSKLENGNRCYFPNNNITGISRKMSGNSDLKNLTPPQDQIFEIIKKNPGISQKELAVSTKLNRFKLSKNLSRLIDLRLIAGFRSGKNNCYEEVPGEELKLKIIRKLIMKLLNNEIDEATFFQLVKELE